MKNNFYGFWLFLISFLAMAGFCHGKSSLQGISFWKSDFKVSALVHDENQNRFYGVRRDTSGERWRIFSFDPIEKRILWEKESDSPVHAVALSADGDTLISLDKRMGINQYHLKHSASFPPETMHRLDLGEILSEDIELDLHSGHLAVDPRPDKNRLVVSLFLGPGDRMMGRRKNPLVEINLDNEQSQTFDVRLRSRAIPVFSKDGSQLFIIQNKSKFEIFNALSGDWQRRVISRDPTQMSWDGVKAITDDFIFTSNQHILEKQFLYAIALLPRRHTDSSVSIYQNPEIIGARDFDDEFLAVLRRSLPMRDRISDYEVHFIRKADFSLSFVLPLPDYSLGKWEDPPPTLTYPFPLFIIGKNQLLLVDQDGHIIIVEAKRPFLSSLDRGIAVEVKKPARVDANASFPLKIAISSPPTGSDEDWEFGLSWEAHSLTSRGFGEQPSESDRFGRIPEIWPQRIGPFDEKSHRHELDLWFHPGRSTIIEFSGWIQSLDSNLRKNFTELVLVEDPTVDGIEQRIFPFKVHDFHFDQERRRLFVSSGYDSYPYPNRVIQVDPDTFEILKVYPFWGTFPEQMKVVDDRLLLVVNGRLEWLEIDLATAQVIRRLSGTSERLIASRINRFHLSPLNPAMGVLVFEHSRLNNHHHLQLFDKEIFVGTPVFFPHSKMGNSQYVFSSCATKIHVFPFRTQHGVSKGINAATFEIAEYGLEPGKETLKLPEDALQRHNDLGSALFENTILLNGSYLFDISEEEFKKVPRFIQSADRIDYHVELNRVFAFIRGREDYDLRIYNLESEDERRISFPFPINFHDSKKFQWIGGDTFLIQSTYNYFIRLNLTKYEPYREIRSTWDR